MDPKDLYADFISGKDSQIPIFYTPWWLDIISDNQEWQPLMVHNKNHDIIGIWPIVKYKRFGLRFAFTPILTPHLGPLIFTPENVTKTTAKLSFEKKVLTGLVESMPKEITPYKIKLHPSTSNWMPLSWAEYTQTTRYTFQLDIEDKTTIQAKYSTKLRSLISNTQDISIIESNDAKTALALINHTYQQNKSKKPFSDTLFSNLDTTLRAKNLRRIYFANRTDGTPIACVYVIKSNETLYLSFIGRGKLNNNEGGVIRKLIDHAIMHASKGVKTFDFEGSMNPSFESLFRSFGGELVPYHEVSRVRSKLLKMALMFWGI